jgi:hypothetical protein
MIAAGWEAAMANIGKPVLASLAGGLFAGTLDIFVASVIFHAPPGVVLQSIASGALGRAAFGGGVQTMLLGLALQEFISVVAAATYVYASTFLPLLLKRPVLCGLGFGAAVNLFLTFIVKPLSLALSRPLGPLLFSEALAANMILFGIPIALIAAWFARRAATS